jgi:hypothetical protein
MALPGFELAERSGLCVGTPDFNQALLERLHGENQINQDPWAKLWYDPFDASCTTPRPSPLPGGVTGSKTMPPFPEKRTKTRKANPSPANLRPQNRRAEWLATGSVRSTLLLVHYGKRSIFAVNWPY